MRKHAFTPFASRQSGAALVVALVMLVVLSMLGVAGMNGQVVELIMGTNTQFQTRVLVNAERTLAAAEVVTQGLTVQSDYTQTGIYNMQNEGEQDPQTMSWSSGNSASHADSNGRYIVEYTGTWAINGNSEAWGAKGTATTVEVYRITARSDDAKGSVRMVQSVFVK